MAIWWWADGSRPLTFLATSSHRRTCTARWHMVKRRPQYQQKRKQQSTPSSLAPFNFYTPNRVFSNSRAAVKMMRNSRSTRDTIASMPPCSPTRPGKTQHKKQQTTDDKQDTDGGQKQDTPGRNSTLLLEARGRGREEKKNRKSPHQAIHVASLLFSFERTHARDTVTDTNPLSAAVGSTVVVNSLQSKTGNEENGYESRDTNTPRPRPRPPPPPPRRTSNSWFPLTDTPPSSLAVRTTPALLGPLATFQKRKMCGRRGRGNRKKG